MFLSFTAIAQGEDSPLEVQLTYFSPVLAYEAPPSESLARLAAFSAGEGQAVPYVPADFFAQIQKFRGVIVMPRPASVAASMGPAGTDATSRDSELIEDTPPAESNLVKNDERIELPAESSPVPGAASYAVMIPDVVEVKTEDLVLSPPESAVETPAPVLEVAKEAPTLEAPEVAPPRSAGLNLKILGSVNDTAATTEGTTAAEVSPFKIPDYIRERYNLKIITSVLNEDPLVFADPEDANTAVGEESKLVRRTAGTATIAGTIAEESADTSYPVFHPRRFIVRFKSDWPHGLENCAQRIFSRGEAFKDYLSDGSSSVDQLNKICQVRSVKSLFMKRGHLNTHEARQLQAKIFEDVAREFPRRAKRAAVQQGAVPDLTNTYVFEVPDGSDIKEICALYENDPHVEYARPDHVVVPAVFPNDPPNDPFYAPEMWALNNTGQTSGTPDADIDAPEAWPLNLGQGTIIAINDTGVDYTHVELAGNIWVNPGEDLNSNGVVNGTNVCPTPNGDFNCVDDDGNGLIDDIRGWDFSDGDNDPYDPDSPFDPNTNWHGTMVAGYAAAVANNGLGVLGIAPSAEIMVIKAFPDGEEFTFVSDLAAGITYAANEGADVINNSWGCISACPSDPTVEAAVLAAHGMGAVVVMAAGNENMDVANFSPQNMDETIAVAATDHNDDRASFSNFGPLLEVAAPGVEVISTFPNNQVAIADGTSFSAPYTAGVAAMIISEHPQYNNEQIRIILMDSADDVEAFGFDNLTGAGRINAHEALTLERVLPVLNPIGDKTADTGILLRFQVFASDPGSDVMTLTAQLAGGGSLASIGASFVQLSNNIGEFSWTANAGQGGLDPEVEFTVTDSPGGFTDSETITITVNVTGAVCGNGTTEPPEECDDNNLVSGDGCSIFCTIELCGDSSLDAGEQCDDGNLVSGDGCTNLCVIEFCGDNIVNNGGIEECDDGNSGDGDGCSSECLDEICGNNRIDFGETCDDGNIVSGDGCDAACQEEATCGNNDVEIGEECDDGNLVDGDGCTDACIQEICGDDEVNDGGIEDCDDGNLVSGDGCSSACRFEICGNDIVDLAIGEECDDGNLVSGDGCSDECFLEICGNGVVDPGEECDDDNVLNGDGCSSVCLTEAVCPNFVCESQRGETCANCPTDCGYCRGLRPRD